MYTVIIAGGRDLSPSHYPTVEAAIKHSGLEISEVVCGMARGVDRMGKRWADERGIPVEPFPVTSLDWDTYGMRAGKRRNGLMLDYILKSDLKPAILAVWDLDAALTNQSRGTKHMIQLAVANARRLTYIVYLVQHTDDGRLRCYRASDEVVRELLAWKSPKRRV